MIMLMFAEDLCDSAAIEAVIMREAYKAGQIYPSRFADVEDFIQVGRLAAWKATKSWLSDKASFPTYARVCVANAIRRAAIASTCALTASRTSKILASKIRLFLGKKHSASYIKSRLSVSDEQWLELSPLFMESVQINSLLESLGSPELPYSLIDDILSIKELTSEERQIIRSRIEGTTDNLGIPATSLQRKLAVIRQKVARGGYGNGS